jgi:4-hydroxy-3-methylbut-2-en-1-yl diphosphate synthase IspG/GcpE
MTITKTADHEATLAQIYALAGAGADVVRCTCNDAAAAEGLARIVPRSPVPIVADIHFQHRLALAALEAGVACLRLNPGNIRKPEQIKAVAAEARDRGVPIRIGVNAGSLDPDIEARLGITPEALVASAQRELAHFAEVEGEVDRLGQLALGLDPQRHRRRLDRDLHLVEADLVEVPQLTLGRLDHGLGRDLAAVALVELGVE